MKGYEKLTWQERYDFEVSWLFTHIRILKGLTQKKLASMMGTKQSVISRAEQGASLPSHGLLKRMAEATGMKLLPPTIIEDDPRFDSKNTITITHHVSL